MIDIDTSSKKEQRNFGLVMAACISGLGVIKTHILHHGFAKWYFIVALVFLVLGLVLPRVLKPVLIVWIKFAIVLNWIMTRLVLSIAFFVMMLPARYCIKWFGTDPLKRAWLPDAPTYWEEPDEQPKELERYLNQF